MARHSLGSLAAKLFQLVCGFLFAVSAARLLGPRGYGIVAVAISMATVFGTIALLGTNELAVRVLATFAAQGSWIQLRNFVRWSARLVMTISLIAACVMAGASLLPSPYQRGLLLGGFAVPLFALHLLLRGLILGSGKVVAAHLPLDVHRWAITLALIGILVFVPRLATPTGVILVVVIALATSLMIGVTIFRRYLRTLPQGMIRPTSRPRWLRQALPFLAVAVFGIIGTEIGTLLVGWLSGPREAGLYQPVAKLAPLMMIANDAIEAALGPKIVHSWEDANMDALQRRVSRSALAATIATTAIVGAVVMTSPYILRAFGAEFTTYQRLVAWIGVAQIINAATGSAPLLLAMTAEMKSRIAAQAATMLVQVGLGIALIPTLGAVGAIAALVSVIIVWSLLHWWFAFRTTGINTSAFGVLSWQRSAA